MGRALYRTPILQIPSSVKKSLAYCCFLTLLQVPTTVLTGSGLLWMTDYRRLMAFLKCLIYLQICKQCTREGKQSVSICLFLAGWFHAPLQSFIFKISVYLSPPLKHNNMQPFTSMTAGLRVCLFFLDPYYGLMMGSHCNFWNQSLYHLLSKVRKEP